MRAVALPRRPSGFAITVALLESMAVLVMTRSLLAGIVLVVGIGLLALVAPLLGTRSGNLAIGTVLLAVTLVLPSAYALRFRIPVGGGGIFIIDVIFALLLAGWALDILAQRSLTLVRTPVALPVALFLLWTGVALVVGYEGGNAFKFILQDTRALAYWLFFFWVLSSVSDRRNLLFFLRLLGMCMMANFAFGVLFSVMGKGEALGFVEEGISRFPAPNDNFLVGAVILTTMLVIWPSGRKRPLALWMLLAVALVGLMLSFTRGYWVGFAVSMLYLLVVLRTQQRFRLVAGMIAIGALLAAATAAVNPALFSSVVTRAVAVTAVQDQNVQYRLIENQIVLREVEEHPVLGNGLGKEYVFDFSRFGVKPFPKTYIHNNYLWFLHRLGIVGLALFVWVVIAFLYPSKRLRALTVVRGEPVLLGLVIGVRALVVGQLVVSVTSPQFNSKGNVLALATLMGLAEVAVVLLRRQQEEDAATADGDARARLIAEQP